MMQWVADNKEWLFSGIGVIVLVGLIRLVRSRLSRRKQVPPPSAEHLFTLQARAARSDQPSGLEILPIWFRISVAQQIPQVDVWLYAVNFRAKPLAIGSVALDFFNLSAGPTLEPIGIAGEELVLPRQVKRILCRRALLESETCAVRQSQHRNIATATSQVLAHATEGRKQHRYSSNSVSISGSIEGLRTTP